MPRISVNQMTSYRWSLEEDVSCYQSAGIAGIGVWRRKLAECGPRRGAALLRDSGLEVASLSHAGDFTGDGGQLFDDSMNDALAALRLAAQIKAGCLVILTGSRNGHTRGHSRRLACAALHRLGDVGRELGVQVAVQPMHCQPVGRWTFLTSLDTTLDLLTRCNHPQVGMVLDTFQFGRETSLCQRMPEVAPWVKIAAVCDARRLPRNDDDRCPPGEGVLPLADVIGALDDSGYCGWYDLQLFGAECWKSDYRKLITEASSGLRAACPQVFAGLVDSPAAAGHDLAGPPAVAARPVVDRAQA